MPKKLELTIIDIEDVPDALKEIADFIQMHTLEIDKLINENTELYDEVKALLEGDSK